MKVSLYGKNSQGLKNLLNTYNLEFSENNPDLIISYGGDGTLLSSEREYPSVPKLPIRDSKVCNKCPNHESETLLEALKNKQLKLETLTKLEANFSGKKLISLNDIVIRNSNQIHAIRFILKKNEEKIKDLIIGDGLVLSTPFGSTGYYKSITGNSFTQNFSIAFNNTTEKIPPLTFTENDLITVEIVRGPAQISSDNNPDTFELKEGSIVKIKASTQKAQIYSPQTLRCTQCKIKRDQRLS